MRDRVTLSHVFARGISAISIKHDSCQTLIFPKIKTGAKAVKAQRTCFQCALKASRVECRERRRSAPTVERNAAPQLLRGGSGAAALIRNSDA